MNVKAIRGDGEGASGAGREERHDGGSRGGPGCRRRGGGDKRERKEDEGIQNRTTKTTAERKACARTRGFEGGAPGEDATCESEAAASRRVFLPGCFPLLASDILEMSSLPFPAHGGHVRRGAFQTLQRRTLFLMLEVFLFIKKAKKKINKKKCEH